MDSASKLLELAKEKFGTLTNAEAKLFHAVAKGEFTDYSTQAEEENDPAGAEKWGDERVLKADRIAWLCTDKRASELVTHRGIQINGARIDGELDSKYARISFPFYILKSAFHGRIDLRDAEIRTLYLTGTHTGPIRADGLKVRGSVFLNSGFKAIGTVRLVGAKVGGNLECNNGEFINQDGSSLNGERLDVKGDVFLCEGDWSENATVSSKHLKFKSKGEVNLVSAKIGGTLECTGGLFRNPGGYALQAGGLKVGRNVYLQNGFRAEGEIGLVDATIEGNLECNNGEFINNRTVEDKEPIALNAERLTVKGDVFLCKGRWGGKRAAEIEEFRAEGEVKLVGARIGGTLQCRGGKFLNPGYLALRGRGLKVEGNVFLDKGFSAEGEVSLVGAQIGGNLDCEKGSFIHEQGKALFANGLKVEGNVLLWSGFKAKGQVSLVGARIDGFFYWMDVQSPEDVRLDLRSAKIGTLRDQEKSWPKKGELFLHGLDYDGIHNIAPREADSRIEWLGRQYNKKAEKHKDQFSPQPYEHLVRVLRKGGQDADAKKILIAKNRDKARLTKLTWSEWLWYRLFGPLISYGYRPLNALWGIVVLIAFGWILFGIGYWCGLITPQSESAYVERDTKIVIPGDDDRRLSDVYPRFNFLVYSVDVFVPLIDLHQTKYWLPNANRGPELFNIDGFVLHTGGVLRLYMWIHIVLGWILTTLLVVGVTGLVRT